MVDEFTELCTTNGRLDKHPDTCKDVFDYLAGHQVHKLGIFFDVLSASGADPDKKNQIA